MEADELRELQELASALEELTKHEGWQVLVDYAWHGPGMRTHHQTYVLNGVCKTPEEYQKYVGWLAGAQAVIDIPASVAKMRDTYSAQETGESAGPS